MKGTKTALFALAILAISVCALFITSRSVTPKKATWEDVLAEAEAGGYKTITTQELWTRYKQGHGDILLVDTRQEWEYRTGYIKGALNFPMEPTWWSRWRKKGALKKLLGSDKNRFIVFY